jgi:hypothetical protein
MLTPADSADADAILGVARLQARARSAEWQHRYCSQLLSAAVNPDYASSASGQMVQHRLSDFKRTPRRCSPVASVRRRSCSHHPETPDAVSSADLAFDQPLKGRSALAGEDECQLRTLVRALDIPWPVGREGAQKLACWLAQRYEMPKSRSWFAWLVSSRSPSLPKVRPTSSPPLPRAAGRSASIDGRWHQRDGQLGARRCPVDRDAALASLIEIRGLRSEPILPGRARASPRSACRASHKEFRARPQP